MAYNVLVKTISGGIQQFRASDAVDIAIITVLIYHLILLTKETRAFQVLKGIGIVFIAALVSDVLQLVTISWLLNSLLSVGIILAVVLFQPELRRALEHLGRGRLFKKNSFLNTEETEVLLTHLANTASALSQNKIGALMVIERDTGLGDYADTGIKIDGLVSSEFLINVFIPNTPLHDGATIIRGNRVVAAGCLLPLTDDRTLNKELGTRHRAAIGMTEQTDSVVIVVSEETGIISLAREGRLTRYLDKETLKDTLRPLLKDNNTSLSDLLNWRQLK